MITRRYQPSDLEEVSALWEKHHSHEFSLPPLDEAIIACVAVDETTGKIVAYGVMKVYAEVVMVIDHDRGRITRARALTELMGVGVMAAQKAGLPQIHAMTTDPDYADVLRKHYGFSNIEGEHLMMEVE
jgi:hypothetical protein